MSYKCVIFDMDGTLLDTLDDLTDSCNYALAAHGLPPRTKDAVRQFVGNGVRRLISLAVPEGTSDDVRDKVLATYKDHYQAHCNDKAHPYAGIPALLTALREKDIRLAVVSNKPDAAVKELCELHFPGMFDVVIGEQEKLTRKPAPDMVKAALKELRIDKRDAVYIGDSEVDIKTARNASLDLIIVDWGFRDRDTLTAAGTKTIASTPDEVLLLLNFCF